TAVDISPLPFATRSLYLKVRDRASYAFALASAGVALALENGRITQARIALGGVGTVPWRAREAEHALAGKRPDASAFQTTTAPRTRRRRFHMPSHTRMKSSAACRPRSSAATGPPA